MQKRYFADIIAKREREREENPLHSHFFAVILLQKHPFLPLDILVYTQGQRT